MSVYTCYLQNNDCYKAGKKINPVGIMVHSTGATNPWIKRYVQDRDKNGNLVNGNLNKLIGENPNNNDWNKPNIKKCVHAFIGKLDDGTIATVQTLPWEWRGWHAGASANNTHISFEICEGAGTDYQYFRSVYREAVTLCANLCMAYKISPDNVISHAEGAELKIASNHGDADLYFSKFGENMDTFRAEVRKKMENKETAKLSAAQQWCVNNGIFAGDPDGNMRWKDNITREETANVLYRLYNKIIGKLG